MSAIMTILAAAEAAGEHAKEAEKSEVPFFIAGGAWALFAVIISVVGFKRPEFPETSGATRGVMLASVFGWITAVSVAIYVAI